MIVAIDPQTFNFDFDSAKYVDENLKDEIKFIIKSSESLTESKTKNKIEPLLLSWKKY